MARSWASALAGVRAEAKLRANTSLIYINLNLVI